MTGRNIFYPEVPEKPAETEIGSVSDFGWGLVDSGLARPYNATVGLVLPRIDLSDNYNHKSIAAQVGDFGGSVADIVILSKFTGWGVNKALGRAAEKGLISASMAESQGLASTLSLGATGGLYGGVFTPGSGSDRLKNATVGLTTFGTMGAASAGLNKFGFLGKPGSRTLFQNVAIGGLSGVPAGFVDAQATSLVNGKGFNTDVVSVGKTMGYYGLFGATMGGVAHGIEAAPKARGWFAEKYGMKGSRAPVENASAEVPRASQAGNAPETVGTPESTTLTAKFGPSQAMTEVVSELQARKGAGITEHPQSKRPVETTSTSELVDANLQKPVKFNIPETGNIELGKMMRETSPADQIRLVQEVVASRPKVPAGSWMRLIDDADMPQFLRAIDRMYPETALTNSEYLINTRNLRPPTPEGTINFTAWEEALATVKAEKAAAAKAVKPKPEEVVPELGKTAEKPFSYEDVTMTVKNPDLLKTSIANNAETVLGTNVLKFANRWATIMERKIAAGEPLTADMARQASLETKLDVRNYEYNIARNLLVDTWQHGALLDRAIPLPEAIAGGTAAGAAEKVALTPAQVAEVNNFGSMLQTIARSRADAINILREMDPAKIDASVHTALLDNLLESQKFLRRMGVDRAESVQSVVSSMKNVPVEEIPRYVHYADQFKHDVFQNSVMSGMDQAVARGTVPPGTQQAWIDAISAKLRIVFPGIKESEWAISKLKNQ